MVYAATHCAISKSQNTRSTKNLLPGQAFPVNSVFCVACCICTVVQWTYYFRSFWQSLVPSDFWLWRQTADCVEKLKVVPADSRSLKLLLSHLIMQSSRACWHRMQPQMGFTLHIASPAKQWSRPRFMFQAVYWSSIWLTYAYLTSEAVLLCNLDHVP